MTTKARTAEQDNWNRIAMAGQPAQDSRDRTAGTGQLGQVSWYRTAGTGACLITGTGLPIFLLFWFVANGLWMFWLYRNTETCCYDMKAKHPKQV